MIRHIFIAAWRNLAANKFLSALAIVGLSLGVAATLMVGLLLEGVLDFNHFIPGYQHVVMVGMPDAHAGHGYTQDVDPRTAKLLALALPQAEVVARLANGSGRFQQGPVAAVEALYWADPNYFQAMPFATLRGDLRTALARPDSVVMTAQTAQKYFGRDDVVGRTLQMDGHPLTITAILKPMPAQSWYRGNPIFVSAQSAFSPLAGGAPGVTAETYLRFKPQADLRGIGAQAHAAIAPLLAALPAARRGGYDVAPLLVPIDRVVLDPRFGPGALTEFSVMGAMAVLLLALSSVNCVSLMVARAGRRTTEVMMRKVCGAGRTTLMLQFLCEAILTVLLAVILGLAVTEWLLLLPALGQAAPLDLLHDPVQAPMLATFVVLLGILVGAWPAFVLSALRPAQISKNGVGPGSAVARKTLVILQFAAVIVMLIAALVMDGQRRYASAHPLGTDIANVVGIPLGCRPPFLAELRKLPGVRRAACSDGAFPDGREALALPYRGTKLQLDWVRAGGDTMAIYGVVPLAGIQLPPEPVAGETASPVMAINRAAALRLGFATPQAAIGVVPFASGRLAGKRIVAVMPDFAFYPPRKAVVPVIFVPEAAEGAVVHVKLRRAADTATLAAIDRLWRQTGGTGSDERYFVSEHHDIDLEMNAGALAGCALLAVFLACLGLVGLTVAAAERRTKEIGVRKAMGASTVRVAVLLLKHFLRPVLWACLIAWPLAGWLMWQWLSGFAYHGAFPFWAFVVASGAALLIAVLTVAWQAWLAARQKPVLALRYE